MMALPLEFRSDDCLGRYTGLSINLENEAPSHGKCCHLDTAGGHLLSRLFQDSLSSVQVDGVIIVGLSGAANYTSVLRL